MSNAVAIGTNAGHTAQETQSVAIGNLAGYSNQAAYSVAIGSSAGNSNQGTGSVAIGTGAGNSLQGQNCVAIGTSAGYINQLGASIAIGDAAAAFNQAANAIAIGHQAGETGQGQTTIAIGYFAGKTNQHSNSIILNASGSELDAANQGFYVKPIQSGASQSNTLTYNTGTGEIFYNTSKTFVIDHPIEKNKYLVHACMEGPEAGVYYRGKGKIINNDHVKIALPEYVSTLAYDFTIQITPIYDGNKQKSQYFATEVINNSFDVYGDNGEFYWTVYGKRNSIIVEPNKSDIEVKGNGPYKWF